MNARLVIPVLALALALGCVSRPEPTAADFEAVVTRVDFDDWLASYALETKREALDKAEKNGSVVIDYDWLGDDGELAIELRTRAYWTRTPAESDAAYRKMRESFRPRRKDAFVWLPTHSGGQWAEAKKCYRIVRADGHQVGHVIFARRENVAAMVMLSGIHADDPKLFERKVEPLLERLSQYDPRP